MKASAHDFVTADMRGLKAALVARAQAERVSVSAVVRRAVERELGLGSTLEAVSENHPQVVRGDTVKLSLRLTRPEADELANGAQRAGLSRGAFLAGLFANAASFTTGAASRPDRLAALSASCAELSTLSRNLHHLTSLLRHGQVAAAREYRQMLLTLEGAVRAHLRMASAVLAGLRPARQKPIDFPLS